MYCTILLLPSTGRYLDQEPTRNSQKSRQGLLTTTKRPYIPCQISGKPPWPASFYDVETYRHFRLYCLTLTWTSGSTCTVIRPQERPIFGFITPGTRLWCTSSSRSEDSRFKWTPIDSLGVGQLGRRFTRRLPSLCRISESREGQTLR
jgi:hypothetical protein